MCPQEELSSFPNSASSLSGTLGLSWCSCLSVSINLVSKGGKVASLYGEGDPEPQRGGLWPVTQLRGVRCKPSGPTCRSGFFTPQLMLLSVRILVRLCAAHCQDCQWETWLMVTVKLMGLLLLGKHSLLPHWATEVPIGEVLDLCHNSPRPYLGLSSPTSPIA